MSGSGSHPSDDSLIDLSAGLLEPEGRTTLLAHLRDCAACEERLLVIYRGSERLAVRPGPGRARGTSPWLRLALPAAAMAALVAGFLLAPRFFTSGRGDGLDYWMPLETERVLLRSGEEADDAAGYREAIQAYEKKDAGRVIALLEGRAISKAYEPLNLLLASALVREGRNADARILLERLDTPTLPQPARDRARFLLYVALRREGREEEARAIARELASGSGEFAARARALLAGS